MASSSVRVFVSHHHSPDEDTFTARLVADLEAAGADVWVDDARITSDDFIKKINEGLAGRQWLVLVMTPDALRSPWVQAEVNAALNQVRKGRMLGVIPIVAKTCDDADIPPLLDALHRYDATHDYQVACRGLLRALGLAAVAVGESQPVAPVGSASPPSPAHSSIPPARFPQRLASFGYQARVINGVEVILPPLCDVPAGDFLMGSDPQHDRNADKEEQPQHRVTLPGFRIARFPISVAEYASFVRTGHAEPTSQYNSLTWQQQREHLDHPVVNISWQDAVAYAAWLAQQTGQPWRLPSEAEWEKAARGIDGRIYPWGNTFEMSRCNTEESGKGTTTPLGNYPSGSSPYGIEDMTGNVYEWTSTPKKPYPNSPMRSVGSEGQPVLRGGSWNHLAPYSRSATRNTNTFDAGMAFYGFRLVLALPG